MAKRRKKKTTKNSNKIVEKPHPSILTSPTSNRESHLCSKALKRSSNPKWMRPPRTLSLKKMSSMTTKMRLLMIIMRRQSRTKMMKMEMTIRRSTKKFITES